MTRQARNKGIPVMHAPIMFARGYGELTRNPYGTLPGVVDGKAFIEGARGAAIVDELTPVEGAIVIERKRGLDTFPSTNLDRGARQRHRYDDPMFSTPMHSSERIGHFGA